MNQHRYPGIRPFATSEQHLFFGRDNDIERLYRLIRLEQIVILYGKSGYGKSSLLQAGIFPKLEQEDRYQFWSVRLGPYQPERTFSPGQNVQFQVEAKEPGEDWSQLKTDSIWEALKTRQTTEHKRFVLFFDQFEELFTYPPAQVAAFRQQLAEALYADLPERFRHADYAASDPFELKVVFSIRSDRMSQLNALKDYLPNLLQHAYELDALDEAQAAAAIVTPAGLPQALGFATAPFQYAPEALLTILQTLRDERGRVETSALQIVCRHVEDNIVPQLPGARITSADLGELQAVFANFYENTLQALPEASQAAARRLCEDVLISPEGVRLPFAGQALTGMGFAPALLDALAQASLLRVERDEQGRMLYEVGHDTLVAPISAAARARREREEKERLQREAGEAKRREAEAQRKQRRAYLLTAGAVLLALLAVAASYFAYLKSEEAGKAAAIILEKEKQVEQNVQLAAEKTQLADTKSREAAAALQRADAKEAEAKRNLEAVQREKTATAEQKRRAAEALELARKERVSAETATTGIVQNLIESADKKIYQLDYAGAVTLINEAYDLVVDRPDDSPLANYRDVVANVLLEMAYYYTQVGQYLYARYELTAAGKLFGQSFLELEDIVTIDQPGNRDKLTQALRRFRPARYSALEARYYPDLVTIPAGEFLMGCDTATDKCKDDELPRHRVRLSAFGMARTETTMWQYDLFCAATGRDISVHHDAAWGEMRGDDPVIQVSWYDAALYANWCSEQYGLKPAYAFVDTAGRPQSEWKVNIDSAAKGYRLPTEAQWEYAASSPAEGRKEGDGAYQRYSGSNDLDAVAWHGRNSGRSNPVGKKLGNAYGLYDMSGNVWEWCQDWYAGAYYQACAESGNVENPQGPVQVSSRVLRGGSWSYSDFFCSVRRRYNSDPWDRYGSYGFRLAQGQ